MICWRARVRPGVQDLVRPCVAAPTFWSVLGALSLGVSRPRSGTVVIEVQSVLPSYPCLHSPLVSHGPRFTPQSRAAQSEQREEMDRWRRIQALQARREREEMDRWRRIQARQARREHEEIDRWRRLQTRREREAQQGVHAHTSQPAS